MIFKRLANPKPYRILALSGLISIIILLLFIVIVTLFFNSYFYDYEELKNNVVKIEIVEVDYLHWEKYEIELIKELNSEETDKLLSELSKIEFIYPFGSPYELRGICIYIQYNNNEFELLSWRGTVFYDENGNNRGRFHRICSEEEWEALLSEFINDIE